jgi:hypothetical protein
LDGLLQLALAKTKTAANDPDRALATEIYPPASGPNIAAADEATSSCYNFVTIHGSAKEIPMITAIVLYDMPESITRDQCLAHYRKIAPGFLEVPGFIRKQFIYGVDGTIAGGAYMWQTLEAAKTFYTGSWLDGIRERYGTEPKIMYFETFVIADQKDGLSYPVLA